MTGPILSFIQALIGAVPRIIDLVKSGRDAKDIKLGEVISTDALSTLEGARDEAADFISNG
jgi:hypothetical protein